MGSADKFCLRWNDFERNISSSFRDLRNDSEFFDVTLACCDERQLQAHKVILSACSPFFRRILRCNPHKHPLIYMKSIKHEDMAAVLDFMYHGEVNVAQVELNNFLAVAEDLNVKGLTQNYADDAQLGSHDNRVNAHSDVKPKMEHRDMSGTPAKRSRMNVQSASSSSTRFMPPPSNNRRSQQGLSGSITDANAASSNLHSTYDDEDEIEDITPVKSEPNILVEPIPSTSVANEGLGDNTGADYSVGGADDCFAEEDYDYSQFEGEGEIDYGTEASEDGMLDQTMETGEGNDTKADDESIASIGRKIDEYLQTNSIRIEDTYQCLLCGKTNSKWSKMRLHLMSHVNTIRRDEVGSDIKKVVLLFDAYVRQNSTKIATEHYRCLICHKSLKSYFQYIRIHFMGVHLNLGHASSSKPWSTSYI